MPPLTTRLAQTLYDLPLPPGATPTATPTVGPQVPQPGNGGYDDWLVILIVVVVLGAVVLIAWLLKPLVARRLTEEEAAVGAEATESGEPPGQAWTRGPARHDTATGPSVMEVVPEPVAPVGEIATPDVAEAAPEGRAETEPAVDAAAVTAVGPVAAGTEPAEEALSGPLEEADIGIHAEEIVGITLTVRELLEFANTGQLLRGFDLYSESYLRRFRAETGLTDEQFAEEYGAIPAPPPEARIELAAVSDVEALPNGRVSALVSFGNGGSPPPPERFVFVHVADRWLIDDITSVD
jgi:hypothetical protein